MDRPTESTLREIIRQVDQENLPELQALDKLRQLGLDTIHLEDVRRWLRLQARRRGQR